MKKLIIYSFMSLLLVSACKRSDNDRIPELAQVPYPQIKKVSGDQIIASQDPASFKAEFSVGLLYPDGVKPQKYDVVVIKNGDKTNVKMFKADVTTFPTTLSITGPQLQTLFGAPTLLGDKYDIGVDITAADGKKYLSFPTVGIPYSPGTAQTPGASTTLRYEAVCKFTMTDYGAIGATIPFVVVKDEWNDYSAGSVINVKIIDDTHMSFMYPTEDAKPIVITVDPVSNSTSVDKVAFGHYGDNLIFSAVSVASSLDNNVSPCELSVSTRLSFTSNAGSYGQFTITLKKK
jgi:hypothetical protein